MAAGLRVNPAAVLAEQLAVARRRGESFEDAWPDALAAALAVAPVKSEREEWTGVLTGMVDRWRAAFERVPADRRERSLAILASDPERVVPLPDRACERCGEEIPPDRGGLSIYCSGDCKDETNRERERARAAV